MHRTRSGVLGVSRKKSGRWRSTDPAAPTTARNPRSDMTKHDFARTPPANRHQIADPAADDEPGGAEQASKEAIGIEDRAGKEPVSILEGHHLATVQMSSQDEVVADMARP